MVTQMEEVVDQSQSQSQSSSQDYKEENELPSVETEENVVKFLDSVDGYLMLMDSLNSTLRQVKLLGTILFILILSNIK